MHLTVINLWWKELARQSILWLFSSLQTGGSAFFVINREPLSLDRYCDSCEVLNCRIFKNILTAMSNDWHKYSNIYAMIDKAILAHRCSKLIISVYSIAVLLYSTASINLNKQSGDDCRELLIKMELPFGFCESPIYEIVMFMQFVRLMAVASAIGILNALLVTLVSYDRRLQLFFLRFNNTIFFYNFCNTWVILNDKKIILLMRISLLIINKN